MTANSYNIKQTKVVHHFIVTRKEDGHKFIMEKTEEADDVTGGRDDIIITDAKTGKEVDNQTWEEINEEYENKIFKL